MWAHTIPVPEYEVGFILWVRFKVFFQVGPHLAVPRCIRIIRAVDVQYRGRYIVVPVQVQEKRSPGDYFLHVELTNMYFSVFTTNATPLAFADPSCE